MASQMRLTQVGFSLFENNAFERERMEHAMNAGFRALGQQPAALTLLKMKSNVTFTGTYAELPYAMEVGTLGNMYTAMLLVYGEHNCINGLASKVFYEEDFKEVAPEKQLTWYVHVDACSINPNHGLRGAQRKVTDESFEAILNQLHVFGKFDASNILSLGYDDVSIRLPGWSKEMVVPFMAALNAILPEATEGYRDAYLIELAGAHNASAVLYEEEGEGEDVAALNPASDPIC